MRDIENEQDVAAILGWMQSPSNQRGSLPEKLVNRLARLRQADLWLNEHMSPRTVVPMMVAKYREIDGTSYSESTARRDIEAAQEVFAWGGAKKKVYSCTLVVALLQESMVKAGKKMDFNALAKLASIHLDYLEAIEQSQGSDPNENRKPVQIQNVFEPALLGFAENPDALKAAMLELQKPKDKVNWALLESTVETQIEQQQDGAGPQPG